MGIKAAVLGPGNIGTDLLVKLQRSDRVDVALMAGIYDDSPGLARARELGVET
jgi:acetaldehyde dehydrogenase (acetylating)